MMPGVDQGEQEGRGRPPTVPQVSEAHASSGPGAGDSSTGSCAPSACTPSAVMTAAIGSGASAGVDADRLSIVGRRVRQEL
jgi:hypothetical protein